jgi:hypothetical protein
VRPQSAGELVFESLDTPTCAETADIAARTAERIALIFDKHGRSLDPEMTDSEPHALQLDEPGRLERRADGRFELGFNRDSTSSATSVC